MTSPIAVRLNRMHHPVTSLGHGVRAGIWVQGCTIGCHGCASRDTWDPAAGEDVEPAAIVRWLDTLPGSLDGVTVSGGEPFQQPAALAALLAALDRWRGDRPIDLLVFSGHTWRRLVARPDCAGALARCDAVVAGPYVEHRNTGAPLRGSDNQEIVALTPLGKRRYGDPDALPAPAMQVCLDGRVVRLIGIPRRGDLDRMRDGLTARGIALEAVTWQG
jgi:anaerobic ribonucleoside-triphosphate reductase activating protein